MPAADRAVTDPFAHVDALLVEAVAGRAFPCAVAEIGTVDGPLWQGHRGRITGDPSGPAASLATIFDLASLTKPIATTTLAMQAVEQGLVALDTRVAELLGSWRGRDREHVTLRDLLAHCAGLPAHLPLYEQAAVRREFEHLIATSPLEYVPRTRSLYSDLGFLLLGFILEDLRQSDLRTLFEEACLAAGLEGLHFGVAPADLPRTAPAGFSAWRRRIVRGEVHDDNAWALGGVAGHAGLFGTAPAVGAFARRWIASLFGLSPAPLARPATVEEFRRRVEVPGSSRALGWDTALATSSCGPDMPAGAVGHTGFTGTSLWIDWRDRCYFVLLTNRTHPTPDNDAILQVRPAFHSAAIAALRAVRGR